MSNDVKTKRARLRDVLAAYGADPKHWPQVDRDELESWFQAGQELADETAQAQALDRLLDSQELTKLPLGAIGRVMAKTADIPQVLETGATLKTGFIPISALLAASLLFGVYLGLSNTTERFLLGATALLSDDWGETSLANLQQEMNEDWL